LHREPELLKLREELVELLLGFDLVRLSLRDSFPLLVHLLIEFNLLVKIRKVFISRDLILL